MTTHCTRRSLLAAIVVATVALVATARAQDVPTIRIHGYEIADGKITVTGQQFGEAPPTVMLDDFTLLVIEHTNDRVVAEMPVIDPGIYLLAVMRDAGDTPYTRSQQHIKIE